MALGLKEDEFQDERAQTDGALERMICPFVAQAGFKVEAMDGKVIEDEKLTLDMDVMIDVGLGRNRKSMYGLSERIPRFMLRIGRAIHRRTPGYRKAAFNDEPCPVCGAEDGLKMNGVLWPELVLQWKLTPAWANWIDQREGQRCISCRSNLRSRHLAKVIVGSLNERIGLGAKTLEELCEEPKVNALSIAEINAAGELHPYLKHLKGLRYSEYGSADPDVPSEDLLQLSYSDNSFDMVVNSDVLEHVPDVGRALSEIRRVLKHNGLYVFTVPMVWAQQRTRRRAELRNGDIVHILPPSYHGKESSEKGDFLVFYEFGRDFVRDIERVGFEVELKRDTGNQSLITFIARRIDVLPELSSG